MFEVDDIYINRQIVEQKFTCDLSKCKGACCTMESDYGAPLKHTEIDILQEILPILKDYIPDEHWKEIELEGFWEEKDKTLMTKSLNNKACLFVYYDGDIAKCAIEKAYFEGKVDFRKPISCHLFPIREDNFGGPILRFEKYKDCEPAIENGKQTKITVVDFCKDSLVREYSEAWFNKVKRRIEG